MPLLNEPSEQKKKITIFDWVSQVKTRTPPPPMARQNKYHFSVFSALLSGVYQYSSTPIIYINFLFVDGTSRQKNTVSIIIYLFLRYQLLLYQLKKPRLSTVVLE
jgi:hypothetical protein